MVSEIVLDNLLPEVFAGPDAAPRPSGVWRQRLTIRRGDDLLVQAESGTGKSSLCSYIYGARTDYRGRILFDGDDIRTFGTARWCDLRCRSLAWLPQEMRLFAELSVMENIMIKNRLTDRLTATEIHAMLERLEIDDKADTPAGLLSVGQQQRAAIIRAVAQPFDFLILDEPVSHLDRRNNEAVAALVCERARAEGGSVIATSVGNHLAIDATIVLDL